MKMIVALAIGVLLASGSAPLLHAGEVDLGEGNLAFKDTAQYISYLKNLDDSQMTEYGGSVPHRKHDGVNPLPVGYKHAQPYLKNLWLGYPFSYQYDRARGHSYAIDDIFKVDRVNRYSEQAGLPATCLNCKTTTIPALVEAQGDAFWSSEFHQYRTTHVGEKHSIGCTNCHDADTMDLVITSFPLDEALKRQGKDWREAPVEEMRSLVCAQCHVEYYFETGVHGVAAKPHFPWDKGMNPDQMYQFYSDGSPDPDGFKGQFVDWTHAVSKTAMIKTQHPEYEMYHDSIHGANGVSCADCHMPEVQVEGERISSHHWTSPLKSEEGMSACMQCHGDKTPEFMRSRVIYHQEKVWRQLLIAQEKSVRAHEAVRLAMEYPNLPLPNETIINEAREMVRKGQWFWDYVSAENSAGFHNPSKALETLAFSQQYSDAAVQLAIRATEYAIAAKLDKPVTDLVKPIMEHSRKLQQSQEHLDSHPWLGYLPLLPEADLVWDGYKRVK